jgi:hypothetical protein
MDLFEQAQNWGKWWNVVRDHLLPVLQRSLSKTVVACCVMGAAHSWIRHAERIESERFPKHSVDYICEGTRFIGRPEVTQEDQRIVQRNGAYREV